MPGNDDLSRVASNYTHMLGHMHARNFIRSNDLKAGYKSELERDRTELASVKGSLEEWYAQRLPEESVINEAKTKFETLMRLADSVVAKHAGTIKTVKAIVDTCQDFPCKRLSSWCVPVLCALCVFN